MKMPQLGFTTSCAAVLVAAVVSVSAVAAIGPGAIDSAASIDDLSVAERISPPSTTTTTTTTTTTPSVPPGGRFTTLPVGAALPSGEQCAARVRSTPEIRGDNRQANQTSGTSSNGRYPRADGDFTGTTDEILQWVACKWGIDEDLVRAQAAKESWWNQDAGGDLTTNQSSCHPTLRTSSGPCPESIGLLQVRYDYHREAFANSDAINSTAYNADYAYAVWRSCFEGEQTWLNGVARGATYGAGDVKGCMGVWFAGRWYTQPAKDYIAAVEDYVRQRVWETPSFANG